MDSELFKKWMEKANRSLFFFIALLFHLILFLMVATWVIFQPPVPVKEDFQPTYVPPASLPPPPPATTTPTMQVSPATVPTTATAITSASVAPAFNVPIPEIETSIDPGVKPQATATPPSANPLLSRLPAIRTTVDRWRSEENIRNSGGDVHNLVAKFPVFLAQYADGDWNCNNYYQGDQLTSGALPNLVAKISEWSSQSLVSQAPKSIAIDSPELISNPPPFIFFTGHKDFHLTDAEITNLRKYLQVGGAIWGDSAFAGTGSRFDVAFHREMKLVLPDVDKNFQPLPMDHPIFTHGWFPMDKLPPGMNFRADPVEVINLDGKLAVIYTPNDYSDLLTLALRSGRDEVEATADNNGFFRYAPDHPLYTPDEFFNHRATYYRNYDAGPSMAAYKLSMNILTHLLIRFDDSLQLTP
jgi:hypothetical protein